MLSSCGFFFPPKELGGAPLRKIWKYLIVSISPACFPLFSLQSLLPWLIEQPPEWPLCFSCLIHLSPGPLWPEWWLNYINWTAPFLCLNPCPVFCLIWSQIHMLAMTCGAVWPVLVLILTHSSPSLPRPPWPCLLPFLRLGQASPASWPAYILSPKFCSSRRPLGHFPGPPDCSCW